MNATMLVKRADVCRIAVFGSLTIPGADQLHRGCVRPAVYSG
jgi:hypothetical protein